MTALLEALKLAKTACSHKYLFSGYGTRFDSDSEFSLPYGSLGKNVIIFGVGMSSSVHVDNERKLILNSWYRSKTKIG